MKLIEHLEHVIGLVDRATPYSEIKRSLLAMHEEVHGYEQAAANQVKLNEEHAQTMATVQSEKAQLVQKNEALEAQLQDKRAKESVDEQGRRILEYLFREGQAMTVEEITDVIGCPKSETDYHCELLRNGKFLDRVRFHGDQRRLYGPDLGYGITQKGREWIIQKLVEQGAGPNERERGQAS